MNLPVGLRKAAAGSPKLVDATSAAGAAQPDLALRSGEPAPAPISAGSVAVLVMVDFKSSQRWWAWSRLVLQGVGLRSVPGLRFAKVLGSGQGGGFGVLPSATHQGLFLGFDDESAALQFVQQGHQLAAYRSHARACAVVGLRATSSRGAWSGRALQTSDTTPASGAVAVLTRASIKPLRARAFWRLSPAAEAALAAAPGCRLAMGLGEAPLLRQATFSLWESTASMEAYARSGAHLQAIRAAYAGGHFSETMFTRFAPLWGQGEWQGLDLAAWLGDCGDAGQRRTCAQALQPQGA
jgi:spheroidene monooxygenase